MLRMFLKLLKLDSVAMCMVAILTFERHITKAIKLLPLNSPIILLLFGQD